MNMKTDMFEIKTYYAIALDPIHVGAGGARLERVDLPIIREPGTNLPKIPGTSLSGPARTYTAMQTNRYRWEKDGKEYSCAGRGGEGGEAHCGSVNPACPVCVPYGFSKGSGNSMQGLAQFSDMHILFFPVASLVGTVWVTSPMALEGLGLNSEFKLKDDDRFYPLGEYVKNIEKLNFGWLMLLRGEGEGSLEKIKDEGFKSIPAIIRQRAVLVSDKLFPKIVDSNLEVRTSVSIDPATGTAEEGALFTYEAIPRGTVLRFDVIYNSGKYFRIKGEALKTEDKEDIGIQWVKTQVEKGLKLFEILGIGGMGTRGMGRIRVLNLEKGEC